MDEKCLDGVVKKGQARSSPKLKSNIQHGITFFGKK